MTDLRLREWNSLHYKDPVEWLKKLRKIEQLIIPNIKNEKIRTLRTNKLKKFKESRQAALLCCGLNSLLKINIAIAMDENSDHDFIARYYKDGILNFTPVQLKELVSESINPDDSLDSIMLEIQKKYSHSKDLVVAIHISRKMKIDFSRIRDNNCAVKEIWLFGASQEDQNKWFIFGNVKEHPQFHEFSYPN
jgi:hypothetical protein